LIDRLSLSEASDAYVGLGLIATFSEDIDYNYNCSPPDSALPSSCFQTLLVVPVNAGPGERGLWVHTHA
jgi:hypothetical protein